MAQRLFVYTACTKKKDQLNIFLFFYLIFQYVLAVFLSDDVKLLPGIFNVYDFSVFVCARVAWMNVRLSV